MTSPPASKTAEQRSQRWGLLALILLIIVVTYALVTVFVVPPYARAREEEDTPKSYPSAAGAQPASSGQPSLRRPVQDGPSDSQAEGDGRTHTEVTVSWAGVVGGGREYRWWAWGREWRVRLWADSSFLAPSMLIRQEARTHATVTPPTRHAHCFHTGLLLGHPDSAIALNICKGLSGVLRVGKIVYFIEPINYSVNENVTDIEIDENILNKGNYDIRSSNNLHNNIFSTVDNIVSSDENSNNVYNISGDEYNRYEENEEYNIFEDGSLVHVFSQMGGLSVGSYGSSSTHSEQANTSPSSSQESVDGSPLPSSPSSTSTDDQRPPPTHHCDVTGSGSKTNDHHRVRRYLYSHRYSIEVMVVVDHRMTRYHGKNLNHYVLTLMSVVALIFRDASIGNRIEIALVEVVQPHRQTFVPKRSYENSALSTGKSAEEMLKMFCRWQKQELKYNTNHPRRYDTALLLTRENICRNPWTKSCDTLGLAELGTMCSKHSSCAIVQDNGLSAAFTIAHEIGHLLNMPHDNDDRCAPHLNEDSEETLRMNVMSRMLDHNTLPWMWSNCSKHYLTEYLQGGHGTCLEDEPWSNKLADRKNDFTLAGELFNATKQCQYVFGRGSSICPYMPTCKRLWCTTSIREKEGCRTQHMPWADGTYCAEGSWCLRGECVLKNKNGMKKVNGQWSDWLPWSECSRTCGVGVRKSERACDSPKPSYGGQYCIGKRVKFESCHMQPCPRGGVDFRTRQCQVYNGRNFGLPDIPEHVKWMPKYAGISYDDSCKLFCQVQNSSSYFQLREKVEDGTTCGPDSYDICINGKCNLAGCDYILNSTAKADTCGVCGGDNTTCELTEGFIKEKRPYGYSDLLIIPEGAARIDIYQQAYPELPSDDNYLALMDLETGEYLLNGHWVVTPFQKLVEFGGTLLEYTGSNIGLERINSTKPVQKKLLLQVLSVGDLHPPHISYSYEKSKLHRNPSYYWKLGEWTNCSKPCVGERKRVPLCVKALGDIPADPELCKSLQKPAVLYESCIHTCPVHWRYTDWSKCEGFSTSCLRKRQVVACVTSLGDNVESDRCDIDQRYTQQECPKDECPDWFYHDWSPCERNGSSSHCMQQRLYSCQLRGRPVQMWECGKLDKPHHIKNCTCWQSQEWTALGHDHVQHGSHNSLEPVVHHFDTDQLKQGNLHTEYDGTTNIGGVRGPFGEDGYHKNEDGFESNDIKNVYNINENQNAVNSDKIFKISKNNIDSSENIAIDIFEKINGKKSRFRESWKSKDRNGNGTENNNVVQDISERFININNLWLTGAWSECSAECGGGEMKRLVVCPGGEGQCPEVRKPVDNSECNTNPCTEWSTGDWGNCRARRRACGRGSQQRLVVCRDVIGTVLEESNCHPGDRPQKTRRCRIPCDDTIKRKHIKYKWDTSEWSQVKHRKSLRRRKYNKRLYKKIYLNVTKH